MAMFIENPLKSITNEGNTKTFITAIRETIKSFGFHKEKTIHPLTAYASQVLFECIIGFDYEWNLHKNYRLEDFITVISLLQKLNNDLFQDYERSLQTKTRQLNTCEEEKRKLELKQTLQLQHLKVQQLFPYCKFIAIDKPSSYNMLSNDKKIVVLNTNVNKHAMYEKVLKHIHPNNPLIYINANRNIELSIRAIYKQLHISKNGLII